MSCRIYADLGNMTLHWAVYADGQWLASEHISTGDGLTARCEQSLQNMLERAGRHAARQCSGGLMCSSSPAQTDALMQALQSHPELSLKAVTADMLAHIPTGYRERSQLGLDRIVNAAAVREMAVCPAIVADLGSCITVDLIDAQGALVGGAIAPGLPVMKAGLKAWTPHLQPALDAMSMPLDWRQPGRTTSECIALGVYTAVIAVTRQLCTAFAEQAEGAQIILTGGDAAWMHQTTGFGDRVDELLTLKGLQSLDRY